LDTQRFATTKIQAARPRVQRIDRAAVDDALLEAVLSKRLVLLHAPAGYGKTTALASMTVRLPAGTALGWVSLDADDDAARLFACIAAALEPFDLPWRTLPEALIAQIAAGGDGARRALAELVNALAAADVPHGVIVLEDLHRVTRGDLLALGDELIERLPANWTLVLSSRVVPRLSLARWRVAGELAEFGQERLRFSRDEAAALARAEGVDADTASLHERTKGWPAGLRLAIAASKTRQGLPAAGLLDRYLFDYLASEVLDDMPPALHDFLLRCSVLPELTAARAAAVSGDPRAELRFDEIEARGLFATTLDTAERTIVLHDLFREALDERLRRRMPGELVPLLQRAAASEADPVRRVGFLLRAEDWAAAEQALAEAANGLFVGGGVGDVQRLIGQFDAQWRRRSPRLARLEGMVDFLRWQWEPMARHAAAAAAAASALGDEAERQLAQVYLAAALYPLDRNVEAEALIGALRDEPLAAHTRRLLLLADATQHMRRGELDAVRDLYAEVVASLEGSDDLFEWWECVPASNWSTLPGLRPLFERFIAGALARIGSRPLPMRGEVMVQRAFTHLWAGRIDAARADVVLAEDDLKWLACSGEMEVGLQLFRLLEGAMSGRADDVRARLQSLFDRDADAGPERRRLWEHQIAIYGVRVSDTLGAPPEVLRRWAGYLKENPLETGDFRNARAVATRGRYAAASGRWEEAAAHFQQVLPKLANMDTMAHHVELRLRCAHAWLRCKRIEDAAAAAAPALERLVREGDRGQALMAGASRLQELAAARWGTQLAEVQQRELRDAAALAEGLCAGEVPPTPATNGTGAAADAGLSSREVEVLELIAAGQSNKHIARALEISPHTVKRHVANILDKLVLQSRGQAAAWWRGKGS
jgi:LuxR family maltose regulon positive regulatory protein